MNELHINDLGDFIYYAGLKHDEYKPFINAIIDEHPDLLNQWTGFVIGFNNFADGITGTSYYGGWITPDRGGKEFRGFERKGDVRRACKEKNINIKKMRKTRYGFCGYDKIFVMKVKDAIEWYYRNNRQGGNYRVYFADRYCF